MLQAYTGTLASIFLVELTDRTRLLALLLSARYRTPWQLILGMSLGDVPAVVKNDIVVEIEMHHP